MKHFKRINFLALFISFTLGLVGCVPSDLGLASKPSGARKITSSGIGVGNNDDDDDLPVVSADLFPDVKNVVNNKCVNCHRVGGAAENNGVFDTSTEASLLASTGTGARNLFIKGDGVNSLFVVRLQNSGNGQFVSNMPIGGGTLSVEEYELIRDWVDSTL